MCILFPVLVQANLHNSFWVTWFFFSVNNTFNERKIEMVNEFRSGYLFCLLGQCSNCISIEHTYGIWSFFHLVTGRKCGSSVAIIVFTAKLSYFVLWWGPQESIRLIYCPIWSQQNFERRGIILFPSLRKFWQRCKGFTSTLTHRHAYEVSPAILLSKDPTDCALKCMSTCFL